VCWPAIGKKRPSTVTQNRERGCNLKNQQNSKLFEPNICM
jgi:hypothetical protein